LSDGFALRSMVRAGPHDREILRLAIPALGALVAEPLYVLADTAVVGHLGTPQLGGLAVASSVLLAGYALFVFLAYGTTAAVSRLLGAGDEDEAAHQAVQGMWLAVLIAVVLMVAGYPLAGPLVRGLGASPSVEVYAVLYLRVSLLGVPALLLTLAGTGYLRGLQDTRTPLWVALGTSVGNLVLELLLIYGLGYGVGASAAATVFAQCAGAAVYLTKVGRDARRRGVGLAPHRRSIRALAVVGRDLLIRTAALRASFLVATAVAARVSVVALGAHQVAFELWAFLALVLDALAIAAQALVGRFLGAGDVAGARAASRRMIEWGVMAGAVSGLAVFASRPWLPHLFTDDARVVAVAGFLLWWVAGMQVVNSIVFVLDGVLIGAGDQRFLAWAMVLAAAAFIPCAIAVLVLDLGIGWLWGALAVLMSARLVALGARFRSGAWAVPGAHR
jgi:putative MATE family efflux protein